MNFFNKKLSTEQQKNQLNVEQQIKASKKKRASSFKIFLAKFLLTASLFNSNLNMLISQSSNEKSTEKKAVVGKPLNSTNTNADTSTIILNFPYNNAKYSISKKGDTTIVEIIPTSYPFVPFVSENLILPPGYNSITATRDSWLDLSFIKSFDKTANKNFPIELVKKVLSQNPDEITKFLSGYDLKNLNEEPLPKNLVVFRSNSKPHIFSNMAITFPLIRDVSNDLEITFYMETLVTCEAITRAFYSFSSNSDSSIFKIIYKEGILPRVGLGGGLQISSDVSSHTISGLYLSVLDAYKLGLSQQSTIRIFSYSYDSPNHYFYIRISLEDYPNSHQYYYYVYLLQDPNIAFFTYYTTKFEIGNNLYFAVGPSFSYQYLSFSHYSEIGLITQFGTPTSNVSIWGGTVFDRLIENQNKIDYFNMRIQPNIVIPIYPIIVISAPFDFSIIPGYQEKVSTSAGIKNFSAGMAISIHF
ncbi:MAG: hypothetical protein NC918_04540 [Candidatus Omnitrophica bacterium]|nr:hypothetical protein [Candidatus Omnitrophota bacterium]